MRKKAHFRAAAVELFANPIGVGSLLVLSVYASIGLLDSMHYQTLLPPNGSGNSHYSTEVKSVLDRILSPIGERYEKTYSAPYATKSFAKEFIIQADGTRIRDYPKLRHSGKELYGGTYKIDLIYRIARGIAYVALDMFFLTSFIIYWHCKRHKQSFNASMLAIAKGKTKIAWRSFLIVSAAILLIFYVSWPLAYNYHIFGTDKVGMDVFYAAVKSIRTGLLIGTMTTLVMLPFAVVLGTIAGYFGGWVDDLIQYLYTTLSSIPGVLLVAAAILSIQIFIDNHPETFATAASRADARLVALCIILGVTSWTNLCRLLRAEALKLREMDYVTAAKALGVGWPKILSRHVVPNLMHIVLITVVLDFSGLVLAEAVLTYVGVGVDPTTLSWGNMIDSARLELAREPLVWWPLLAAFCFMFIFVLAANLLTDAVRDAFDPRLRFLVKD